MLHFIKGGRNGVCDGRCSVRRIGRSGHIRCRRWPDRPAGILNYRACFDIFGPGNLFHRVNNQGDEPFESTGPCMVLTGGARRDAAP